MRNNILLILLGILSGSVLSLLVIFYTTFLTVKKPVDHVKSIQETSPRQVIGFLPYWLLSKAHDDYSQYITTLTYFALRIDKDGSILKKATPTEEEPGWYALKSGKVDSFFQQAKANNITLSLALDSGDIHAINTFIASPAVNAHHLVASVMPIMKQYGFRDLNLDVEYTQLASDAARMNFTQFVKAVRQDLPQTITLTLEISPIDAIQKHLIDIQHIAPYVSHIVMMAYDYHAPDSIVTGPVAPLSGAGTVSEYDVATAVNETLQYISANKLILGIPLYGYEWETLGTVPRSAVIPGSGVLASNRRVESVLSRCSTCAVKVDSDAQESYVSYFSVDTDSNHVLFFPDKQSTEAKIVFANKKGLGGIALWALGYEGNTILDPLSQYKGKN